jgi:hypothetical protein
MGRATVAKFFSPAVRIIESAIKMELPNSVQSVEATRSPETWEWVIHAHIKNVEGVVTVRAFDNGNGKPPIVELANKLRVFC